MSEFECWQWLIQNNQVMGLPTVFATSKHYSSDDDVYRDWGQKNTEYCFTPLKAIEESHLEGELAERVYDRDHGIARRHTLQE